MSIESIYETAYASTVKYAEDHSQNRLPHGGMFRVNKEAYPEEPKVRAVCLCWLASLEPLEGRGFDQSGITNFAFLSSLRNSYEDRRTLTIKQVTSLHSVVGHHVRHLIGDTSYDLGHVGSRWEGTMQVERRFSWTDRSTGQDKIIVLLKGPEGMSYMTDSAHVTALGEDARVPGVWEVSHTRLRRGVPEFFVTHGDPQMRPDHAVAEQLDTLLDRLHTRKRRRSIG